MLMLIMLCWLGGNRMERNGKKLKVTNRGKREDIKEK